VRHVLFLSDGACAVFCQGSIDISWHGYINVTLAVLPIKCQSAIKGSGDVDGDGILLLNDVVDMVKVGTVDILNPKVVDY